MTHAILGLPLGTVRDIGWTLIHFLWQGLILVVALQVILPMCRTPVARHNWALGTLVMMAIAPVLTFLLLHGHDSGSLSLPAATTMVPQSNPAVVFASTTIPTSWIDWVVVVWLAGIVVLSIRALGGWYLADALRRRDTVSLPLDLIRRFQTLQRRLALTSPIQFLQSHRVRSPAVVGWMRPVVLIPIGAITGLSPQYLDALIVHELAHIRRFDAFTNLGLIAVETLLFYHPAVWWISRRVRIEREQCCDNIAVSICGDAEVYVEALTTLEAWKAAPALALAASDGRLKERVARLLGILPESRRFSLSAVVGVALLCLIGVGLAVAQDNLPPNNQTFAMRVVAEGVADDTQQGPPGTDRLPTSNGVAKAMWLKREGQITAEALDQVRVSTHPDGKSVIEFTLTPEGAAQFAALTQANVGHRIAIVVNGAVISAPSIKSPIVGGKGYIEGNFTEAAANTVADAIRRAIPPRRDGALPSALPVVTGSPDPHGVLGITITDITPELARNLMIDPGQQGAFIVSVAPNSPAANAGLKAYDSVVAVDGLPILRAQNLVDQIRKLPLGTVVDLSVADLTKDEAHIPIHFKVAVSARQ